VRLYINQSSGLGLINISSVTGTNAAEFVEASVEGGLICA
jgi:hypothetical protein